MSIDEGIALTGVSCPSASLCVAVDEAGDALRAVKPGSGAWSREKIDASSLSAVSCSSTGQCVAVDSAGNALASGHNGEGGWPARTIALGELLAVSCSTVAAGQPAELCVASDATGETFSSVDPGAGNATWSVTPVDPGERLTGLSCAASQLCAAVDGRGDALSSDQPTAALPEWSGPADVDSSNALTSISCLQGGFCLAVDALTAGGGRSLSAHVAQPQAMTVTPPTEVTSSGALLVGKVNAHDAVLLACRFEYGTALAYTQSAPCSTVPAANAGEQTVSAQITGLTPNTAYHYRIVASSRAGTGLGADAVFTTAASPLVAIVAPNPSIAGTPAVGQRLTCNPGTPAGVTLAYAWLRDQVPIAGRTASTYTVQGQDSGHHLQCQVTTTDAGGSATAKSAFVTIPVGGVPASAGETVVGAATFRSARVNVPITCSPRAGGGCELALRLQAVEALSGRRVVAIAARAASKAHGRATALRHRTITLASVRVHLQAGAHATIAVALSATARRLLAARRRFSAYLYVSGTVIGVIEAQLARQLLTLSSASHSASVHVRRR
jgi:hypothetical protein